MKIDLTPKVCALCGHKITLATCGSASTWVEQYGLMWHVDLCHTDDHSCYHRWTVYGERPGQEVSQEIS